MTLPPPGTRGGVIAFAVRRWQTVTGALTPVTGPHTVFVTFANDADDEFMNLNYFTIEH